MERRSVWSEGVKFRVYNVLCLIDRHVGGEAVVNRNVGLATYSVSREAVDVAGQVAVDPIGQGVDQTAAIFRCFETETEQAGLPFANARPAVQTRDCGFVALVDVLAQGDRSLQKSNETARKRLVAPCQVEKIQRQLVVHRGEEMSLSQFDAVLPECTADGCCKTGVIAGGHADQG